MKNRSLLLFCFLVLISSFTLHSQNQRYTYNTNIGVKQGASLAKLKNPFTGGFELPQFSVIDLNLDGTMDLLVFDKGTKKFYTFINDGIPNTVSYSYAPQYEAKFPKCNNLTLTYDYNNDGKLDLIAEANGYIVQYRNTSTSSLSFRQPDTLNNFDSFNIFCPISNIPSFNDIDNDGDMDILTWDSWGDKVSLYKNFRAEKGLTNDQWQYKLVDECWGKFDLFHSMQLGVACQGNVTWPHGDDYTPPPAPNQSSAHDGVTLLTLDIDSDGDYDAFMANIFIDYLYFLKNGKKEFNYPKDTMIAFDSLYPSPAELMQVANLPAAFFLDVDNDAKRDIIMAPDDGGGDSKNKNQIYFYKNMGTDRKPIFKLIQKNFLGETTLDLGGGTSPAFADIDNDGDDDLFIATHGEFTQTLNNHDVIVYYKNTGTRMNPVYELQDTNFLNLYSKNYSWIKPCFGDLNGDGKQDILLGEANGSLKYYINTSGGVNITFTENTTQFASFHDLNFTSPFLVDYDRDGKMDLFLGNYDGTIKYFKNTGSVISPAFTKMIDSVGKICLRLVDDTRTFYNEGISVPVVADLDKDGKFDLLVGGKYGIYLCKNIEGKLNDSLVMKDSVVRFSSLQLPVQHFTGLYAAPAIAQLDSDSYYDILVGNNGGGVSVFSTFGPPPTGIHPLLVSTNKLLIKPNPASNTIIIEGFENEMYSLIVYDATGKEVMSKENTKSQKQKLDISSLQQGVYFITLISENGETYFGKFVKR